jgi:hypothetical protein
MWPVINGAVSVAAAAASRPRRRRRRVAPKIGGASPEEDAKIDGQKLDGLAGDMASAFRATDDDRKRRAAARKQREREEKELDRWAAVETDDVLKRINEGEDPNFFGAPFIWIQNAHLLIVGYVVALLVVNAVSSDIAQESAVFAYEENVLTAIKQAISGALVLNVINAVYIFYEEYTAGDERLVSAVGWALKALVLGGVASWQRTGRILQAEEKKLQAELKKQRMEEESAKFA